jgi:hypothetical protein
MSGDNNTPNDKVYGSFKVSEFSHGKEGYKIEESQEIEERKRKKEQFIKQLENDADLDYKKQHKLGEDESQYKAEYKSTRDALKEFSPWQWTKQLEYVKRLTPEEYETCLRSIDELKLNIKYYSVGFIGLSIAFTYWQRVYLPKGFFPFAVLAGATAGAFFGSIRTARYFIERLDMLGKDYELSRMVKQDIFDTRSDIDSSTRAHYYMHQ